MRDRPRRSESDRPSAADGAMYIRAHCPDCGDVRFSSQVAVVHVQPSGAVHISYACPRCRRRNAQKLPAAVADHLRRAGVTVRPLARPAEVDEFRVGSPIDEGDVAAFVAALDRPDGQAELAA